MEDFAIFVSSEVEEKAIQVIDFTKAREVLLQIGFGLSFAGNWDELGLSLVLASEGQMSI